MVTGHQASEMEEAEPICVLAADGSLRPEAKVEEAPELLLEMYRWMMYGRIFDTRLVNLQRQGRLFTYAPIAGQEAIQVGCSLALRAADWLLGSYRDGLAGIVHGLPAEHVLLFFRGHPNAGLIPPGINVFWQQIGIAEQIPHAVGVAWGMQRCQVEAAALTLFGDGATSEGAFHEGLNFAGVLCAPVVFVCQNNGWAISVPRRAQTVSETIAQKAVAYGMPGRLVDGNDVLAVYREVKAALQRAYAGQGPTLLEMVTYRLGPHSTADDPSRYRSASEQLEWQDTRDPLLRLRVYLTRQALWDDEQQQRLEQKLRAEIADAVTTALAAPVPAPETMFEHVYETPSFLLMEQRQELLEYCQSVEKGVSFP